MTPAARAIQRPSDARLLVIGPARSVREFPRTAFVDLLRPHDIVVANDNVAVFVATLPLLLCHCFS